ncbi:NAD-binding protein [Haloplanus pelagicus]|uniref:NAD-binding protein n=1 Tax=Haloplanus pelagicus TaxID=2949995 RepID=UPI00203DFDFD|nr:NAD-binding protein [Haloplanus sp. HW8-1]
MATDTDERPDDTALEELFHRPERVPLVYWRAFSGARTAVWVTGAAAVLAFIAGLSHLSQASVVPVGPLAGLLPPGTAAVIPLASILGAFLLTVAAAGLRAGYRLAWYGALVLFPVLLVVPLVTGDATDVALFVGGAVGLPLVTANRSGFDRALDLSPFQTTALLSFVAVQVYGTVGTYAMREDFTGVESLTDAFYYIIVTGTTVGYGDATPTTQVTKLFTLSVIVLGTGAFTVATGSLIVPALESRISSAFGTMTASELTLLEDHVLVLGYGELTEPLLDELDTTTDVVVVTPEADLAATLDDRAVNVLTADPTDEEPLLDARIDAARGVVVATDDDARDALAVVAARQANPDVRIVAAATDQRHVDKLEAVGADVVVSPAVIGGRLLGRTVLGERGASLDGLFDEGASDGTSGE